MTPEPTIPVCPICKKDLGEFEISLNHPWHAECAKCAGCGNEVAGEIIEKCLSVGKPLYHQLCEKTATLEKLRNHELPIFIEQLQLINENILAFHSTLDGRITDVELLGKVISTMRETAANVKFALDQQKDKIRIHSNQEYVEKLKTEKKEKAEKKAAVEEKKIRTQEKTEMFAKERENPQLRNFRKAVEAIEKLGTPHDLAVLAVQKQMGINENGEPIQ